QFDYDPVVHNLSKTTVQPGAPDERITTFQYDPSTQTFPEVVVNPLLQQQTMRFDPLDGALISATDANGITETRTYDGFGRLTEVNGPSGHMRISLKTRNDPLPVVVPGAVTLPADRAVLRVFTEDLASTTTAV